MNTTNKRRNHNDYRRVKRAVDVRLETKLGFDIESANTVLKFYEDRIKEDLISYSENLELSYQLEDDIDNLCLIYCELECDKLKNYIAKELRSKSEQIKEIKNQMLTKKRNISSNTVSVNSIRRYIESL